MWRNLRNKEERFVCKGLKTVELLNLLFVLFIREDGSAVDSNERSSRCVAVSVGGDGKTCSRAAVWTEIGRRFSPGRARGEDGEGVSFGSRTTRRKERSAGEEDLRNKEERFVYRVIKTVELLNLLFVLFIREGEANKGRVRDAFPVASRERYRGRREKGRARTQDRGTKEDA